MGDLVILKTSNDQNIKVPCQLARTCEIEKISKICGENIEDEETQLDLAEEQYEEEVRLWLRSERALEVQEQAKNFTEIARSDDYRSERASYYGGYQIEDVEVQTKLRSAASDLVCQAASAAWAGNFKLSNIPFPIKASHGFTELQMQSKLMTTTIPLYLNYAAATNDKVERMKFVIAHAISYLYVDHTFEKPVESQLGETVQAYGQDGSCIYMEQTNTEPPTSHYLIEGPNGNYSYSGYLEVNASPGLLSVAVLPKGFRKVVFRDGQTIVFNHHDDSIYNLTYGTMGHQITGKLEFKDKQNDMEAFIQFGYSSWKKQDYFTGQIIQGTEKLCDINGNYMGFMDFDGKRYWDVRETDKWYTAMKDWEVNPLPSDSSRRLDVITFKTKDAAKAQIEKDLIESRAQKDEELRIAATTRRKEKQN